MINIIGVKRVVVLVILASFNVTLAAVVYMYATPEYQTVMRQLRGQRSQLSSLQNDVEQMQIEFDQLDHQQERFDEIKEKGFFSAQDRADAKDIFSLIQKKSRIISAHVSVKPGYVEENDGTKKAKHKLLISDVSVRIKAFDDNDVYHYIDLVQKVFPGFVSLEHVSVRREKDISTTLLRAIANGASPEIVTAEVEFLWRTMIPENQVLDKSGIAR
ncbi:MAG: hypothetical protein KAJ40_05635 [Alphaproteobacteria bacterium]|nr:hypothetical protein [Alphaproteobacteria bacterium]